MKKTLIIGGIIALLALTWYFLKGKISFSTKQEKESQTPSNKNPVKENKSALQTLQPDPPATGVVIPIVKENPANQTGVLKFNPVKTGVTKRATTNTKGASVANGTALILYAKDAAGNFITDKGAIPATDVSITGAAIASEMRSDYTTTFTTDSSFKV